MGLALTRSRYNISTVVIVVSVSVALLTWSSSSAWGTDALQPITANRAATNDHCPPFSDTTSFTFAYGEVTVNGQPATVGTVVAAHSPRGDLVGCVTVTTVGHYGFMHIYGEDTSVLPVLPGMRDNEPVTFRLFGSTATATPTFIWHNDRDVHEIDLAVTVTAPVAPQVTVRASGADLRLTWSSAPGNLLYEVHHDTLPIMQLSATTLLATKPAGSTSFTHLQALTDLSQPHFYVVRALGNGGAIADSAVVGAINYPLNQNSGRYSLIGLPFATTDLPDAATLAAHIGHVQAVLKWNASTQNFRFFVPPTSGDNFPLSPGDAIFLQMAGGGAASTTITGHLLPETITLTPGRFNFVTIPPQKSTLISAADVAGDIGGVTALLRWNAETQLFRFFAPPNAGDRFAVNIGTPVIVNLSTGGPTQWP